MISGGDSGHCHARRLQHPASRVTRMSLYTVPAYRSTCTSLYIGILNRYLGSIHTRFKLPNQNEPHTGPFWFDMAEREGFEPSIRCRIHTFQACAFDRSATSPINLLIPL